ncbi:MAG: DUF5074 domain-containing protein [Hyphomicrobiales bacterium]
MNSRSFTVLSMLLFLLQLSGFAVNNPQLINDYQSKNTIYFTSDNVEHSFTVNDNIIRVYVNNVGITPTEHTFTATLNDGENTIRTCKEQVIQGIPMEITVNTFTIRAKKVSYLISNGGYAQPGTEVTITFDALDAPVSSVPSHFNPFESYVSFQSDIANLTTIRGEDAIPGFGTTNLEVLNKLTFTIPAETPENTYTLTSGNIYSKWYGDNIYDDQPSVGMGAYEYNFSTLPDIQIIVSNDAVEDNEGPVVTCSLEDNHTTISKYLSFTASALDAIDGIITPIAKNGDVVITNDNGYSTILVNGNNIITVEATDGSNNTTTKTYNITYNMQGAIDDVIEKIEALPTVEALVYTDRQVLYSVYNLYLTLTTEEQALVTNNAKLTALRAKMDQLDADQFPDYTSDWSMFRKDKQNSGIVNIELPTAPSQTTEKWAVKFGSGMFASAGTPLVVNNELYIVSGSKIKRLNKETGEVLAEQSMVGSMGFHSFPAYGEGKIFVPVGSGRIQAFNAETLASIWVSTSYAHEQTNSPVIYHNGYIYSGSGNAGVSSSVSGHYFCLSVNDEDPSKGDEVKEATWVYQIPDSEPRKAFYWSGGCIIGDYIYFGGDNGNLVAHHLINDEVIDTYDGNGDLRASVSYDATTNRVFYTTKGGWLYSIELQANGTFNHETIKSLYIGASTCSPVIYNGRVYVASGTMTSGGGGINVIDANDLTLIYKAQEDAMFQSSGMLTTAYATEENNNKVYVYFLPNGMDSKILMLTDFEGNTTADIQPIFTPSHTQMCTQSLVCDADGNMYYSNDTGYLFAVGKTTGDQTPTVANAIEDMTVVVNAEYIEIDLSNVFDDTDNDNSAITKTASSSSNIVVVSVTDNTLTLNFPTENTGTATITVEATSNGKTVTDSFVVTVEEAKIVVENNLDDIRIEKNAEDQTIDLSTVFRNLENPDNEITITATSSSDLVEASINNKELTLSFTENQTGVATITIEGSSNDNKATTSFDVEVIPSFEDISYWVGSGSNQAILQIQWNDTEGSESLAWGYRWDGEAKGIDMLEAVAEADPRLYAVVTSGTAYGTATGGFGYDINMDQEVGISKEEQILHPNDKGLIDVENYDFDGWTSLDTDDYFASGWTSDFWSYQLRTTINASWESSDLGASSKPLANGSVHAFLYTEVITGGDDFAAATPNYIFTPANNGEQAPIVANPIEDIILPLGTNDPQTVSLAGVFTDPDNNDLFITYALGNISAPDDVTAELSGEEITLTFNSERIEGCDIEVIATSNKKTVSHTFTIKSDITDYTKGVFIVNEDWFGHDQGSVNFLREDGTFKYRVYREENPNQKLGTTTQYGTIYGDNFYFVSKQAPRLVVTNATTLKKVASFDTFTDAGMCDGRSFIGINPTKGYIGTSDGIYLFDIENMTVGTKIENTSGQVGNMLKVGEHVFAVQQNKVIILKDDAVLSTVEGGSYSGIALSLDGMVYVGANTKLLKINPNNLETETIDLPSGLKIPSAWGAWNAGTLCASNKENALYWISGGGMFGGGNKVYKYTIGDISSLDAPFITIPDSYNAYGAAIRLNPVTDEIVITGEKGGYNKNAIFTYEGANGNLSSTHELEDYYWFPALPVFPDTSKPEINISDFSIRYNSDDISYIIKDVVTDKDQNPYTIDFSIANISDPNALGATIEDGNIVFSALENKDALVTVALQAISNGKTVNKEVKVQVEYNVGINEVSTNDIKIYPLPFDNYINLNTTDLIGSQYRITTLMGQLISSGEIYSDKQKIETNQFNSGTYLIIIENNNQKLVKKLIKR